MEQNIFNESVKKNSYWHKDNWKITFLALNFNLHSSYHPHKAEESIRLSEKCLSFFYNNASLYKHET